MLGFMTFVVGLQADVIANNRKLLEDIQYRVRRMDYKEESHGDSFMQNLQANSARPVEDGKCKEESHGDGRAESNG